MRTWTSKAGIRLKRELSSEFKAQQIQRVQDGESISQVARDCGVHYGLLCLWTRQAGISLKTNYRLS
ncbi:transposase [Lacticaseibacillus paracasei]